MVQGTRPQAGQRPGRAAPRPIRVSLRWRPMDSERPVLALDVDGVISLFGFEGPIGEAPGRFHPINGMAHSIPDGIGPMAERLAPHYEIVWATGWEDRANERLPEILGLPGE